MWAQVGEHMRALLAGMSLADIAAIAKGEAAWPASAGAGQIIELG